MTNQSLKANFIKLLRSTKRTGIENVIEWLDTTDFYAAPASTMFHGNYEGGLLEHSMNVAHVAIKIKEMLDTVMQKHNDSITDEYIKLQLQNRAEILSTIPRESILIVGLLHDICKANIYKKEKRNRKIARRWEEVEVFGVDYSNMPLGHGEKTVIQLLRLGLDLTTDEIIAIRWHMSAWDLAFQSAEAKGNLNAAKEQCLLLSILQVSDQLATAALETTK